MSQSLTGSQPLTRHARPTGAGPIAVTAIIPCFNEVECVTRAYEQIRVELARYDDYEMLFVDDGSTDGTLDLIKSFAESDTHVHYLSFARNFGLEAAFSAGFRYAGMPWTVQLDADLQSPPAAMHALIARALDGYDIVFAIREDRADPWFRRIGAVAHQTIARRLLGIELPLGASVFRVVRTSVARKIVEVLPDVPYFLATAPLLGARYTTVVTAHQARQAGRGKWSVRRLFAHATDLFIGFSYRPLMIVYGLAALGVIGAALVFGLDATARAGAATTASAALGTGVALLVAVAVVTRYLSRLIRGKSGLPQFQVREANIDIRPADSLYEYEREPHRAPDLPRRDRPTATAA